MYWVEQKQRYYSFMFKLFNIKLNSQLDRAQFKRIMKRHILLHFILPFAPIVRNYNCVKHGYRENGG